MTDTTFRISRRGFIGGTMTAAVGGFAAGLGEANARAFGGQSLTPALSLDSLQLTAKHKVATPVNWKQGDNVIIAGSVSDEDAKKTYPNGWSSPRPYIRIVPQPGVEPV